MATRKFQPVKRPGAATRQANRAGMSVQAWARKNKHAPGRKGEQARFVRIARKWRKAPRRANRR